MNTVWHVCSVVVHVNTERMAAVNDALEKLPNVDVAASDSDTGKMAVVLESDSEDTLLKHIASIRELAGVLAVSLVYHQLDEPSLMNNLLLSMNNLLINKLRVRKYHETQSTTLYEGERGCCGRCGRRHHHSYRGSRRDRAIGRYSLG
ncbi:chaperone NapD [Pectobacterium punjabense]|uniref:chaperone NapD n=1 Tax=Pectobacterium punjabense TaxID=2108399 RepID=UPI001F0F29EB|nr:chaperone NapD [Pectobacterium punjabense]